MRRLGKVSTGCAMLLGLAQGGLTQKSQTTLEDTGRELLIVVGPVDLPAPMGMEMAGPTR